MRIDRHPLQGHPRSKPFQDHVLCFSAVGGRIIVRHYQVVPPLHDAKKEGDTLVEIGPRLALTPIRIFTGAPPTSHLSAPLCPLVAHL